MSVSKRAFLSRNENFFKKMKSWKERREDTLREIGVEIRDVPGCGRGLFARRDFEVGEIVLKESPLISLDLKEPLKRLDSPPIDGVPEEKRENLRIFLNYMKKLEAFLFQASLDTQEAMLDCYCGDDLQPTDSLLARATSVANFCLSREKRKKNSSIQNQSLKRMRRGILAFDLNSWGVMNPGTKHLVGLTIFDVGSKINHSCRANTATDGAGT